MRSDDNSVEVAAYPLLTVEEAARPLRIGEVLLERLSCGLGSPLQAGVHLIG